LIVAIDPGPLRSGYVLLGSQGDGHPQGFVLDNAEVLERLFETRELGLDLAIEMIASYGMPVGAEVFDTCVFIGRCLQTWFDDNQPHPEALVYRTDVKMTLCHSTRAKDGNVRQALIDRWGGDMRAIGNKKCPVCKGKGWRGRDHAKCGGCGGSGWLQRPGPLAAFTSHMWPALGVAVTYRERAFREAATAS
jgi:hypothetical protein